MLFINNFFVFVFVYKRRQIKLYTNLRVKVSSDTAYYISKNWYLTRDFKPDLSILVGLII